MSSVLIPAYVVLFTGKSHLQGIKETEAPSVSGPRDYIARRSPADAPRPERTTSPTPLSGNVHLEKAVTEAKPPLQSPAVTHAQPTPQSKGKTTWRRGLVPRGFDSIGVSGWRRWVGYAFFFIPIGFFTLVVLAILSPVLSLMHVSPLPVLLVLGLCHLGLWGWPDRSLELAGLGVYLLTAWVVLYYIQKSMETE